MNPPTRIYWKVLLGAFLIFGSASEIMRLLGSNFNGEVGVMITTSVLIAVGGFYLLYTGLYPAGSKI